VTGRLAQQSVQIFVRVPFQIKKTWRTVARKALQENQSPHCANYCSIGFNNGTDKWLLRIIERNTAELILYLQRRLKAIK